MERTKKPTKESFTALANSLTTKTPYKGLGADSEEKHEAASDIDTAVVDSLKALDPEWPIREADILVVADEADPTVRPFQSHKVAGLDRLRILPDRDHLAAAVEPGGGDPHRGARIDAEEHAHVGGAGAQRVRRLDQPHVVSLHRAAHPSRAVEQGDIAGHVG